MSPAPTVFTTHPIAEDTADNPPSDVAPQNGYTKDEKGRFVTGNIGGGRPLGSRNKLSEAYCDALLADFEEHGVKAIRELREKDLVAYCKAIGAIVPREFGAKIENETTIIKSIQFEVVKAERTAEWIESVLSQSGRNNINKTPQ